jgi:acetyl-CoA carboxylase carboxyltransferase component
MFDFNEPTALATDGINAIDTVNAIADAGSVVEIKSGYGSNLVTALATVAGSTVGFVAFDGNAVCPHCAYKAEYLIKLCDAYNIPVVTVANADGLVKEANEQMLVATTKLTSVYATATCPKISLITGQAIGSAYIVLAGKGANADVTLAWDNSVVSPLDVEASVAFLYNDRLAAGEDRNALETEYKETIGSPFTAAACGAIDDVFAPDQTRAKIITALDMLAGKRETTIARKHSVK